MMLISAKIRPVMASRHQPKLSTKYRKTSAGCLSEMHKNCKKTRYNEIATFFIFIITIIFRVTFWVNILITISSSQFWAIIRYLQSHYIGHGGCFGRDARLYCHRSQLFGRLWVRLPLPTEQFLSRFNSRPIISEYCATWNMRCDNHRSSNCGQ